MSFVYNGAHSITFIEALDSASDSTPTAYSSYKRSWRDFHLIPEKRPSVSPPTPSLNLIDVPGTNKRIDMTDLLPGGLKYGRRTGEWQFILDHYLWDNWHIAKKTIEDALNGKRLYCVLEDDFNTAYRGRFKVTGWQSGPDYSSISIAYELEPKKYINAFSILDDKTESKMLSSWYSVDSLIKDGSYKTNLNIGDTCFLAIPGEYYGYAEIGGIDIDIDANGKHIPVTWFSRNLLNNTYPIKKSSYICRSYLDSDIAYCLNSIYMDKITCTLKSMIKSPVKYMTRYAGPETGDSSYQGEHREEFSSSNLKIWIPSIYEISLNNSYESHGPKYSQYFNVNIGDKNSRRVKTKNNDDNAIPWFTRTYEYASKLTSESTILRTYYGAVDKRGWAGDGAPPYKEYWWDKEPGTLIGFCTGASNVN